MDPDPDIPFMSVAEALFILKKHNSVMAHAFKECETILNALEILKGAFFFLLLQH